MKSLPLLISLSLAWPAWAQNPFTVRVLDAKNAPIAGAKVSIQVWNAVAKAIPDQTTDPQGAVTFSLPVSPNGQAAKGNISVVAPGFAFNNATLAGKDLEIHLEPGTTWRGKVTDEAGKPIAGAKVRVIGAILERSWETRLSLSGEKNSAQYTTTTGADGNFSIADVPAKMQLQFGVEHPDFAVKSGNGVSPNDEITIKLAPGGAVHGRVVDVAGKPLAGLPVYASPIPIGEGGNSGKTDENGAFTIKSLGAGSFTVGTYFEALGGKPEFVLPRVTGIQVEVGKVVEAPEIHAVPGVVVAGMVRDAVTQKPLEGANLYAQNGDESGGSAQSDAAGHFMMRVLPGNYKIYISGPPEGYLRPETQKSLVVDETAPADLLFDLKKATVLHGTIVDETGKPLQVKLKANVNYSNVFIESDAQGKWQFQPEGSQKLQLGGGDAEDGYFDVVSPLTIEAGTDAATTIVLRKMPWQVMPGRTLVLGGAPLEGARIEGEFYTPMGDGNGPLNTSQRTATSNANGDFVLPRVRDGIKSGYFKIGGKKDGFTFQSGGELVKNGPVWQVSDLIFVPLSAKIEGMVAPGARVTVGGHEVVAGPDGKFAFEALPASANQVFAFKEGQFGGAKVGEKAPIPLKIELQPLELQGRDEDLAHDIWSDVAREATRGAKDQTYWNINDINTRLEAKATTFEAQAQHAGGDMGIVGLADKWAGKTGAAGLDAAFAPLKNDDMRVYAYLIAASKVGDAPDDKLLISHALEQADANFKMPEKEMWWREMNLYRAAAVTQKSRGDAAGFAALDRAVAFTLKNHGLKSTRADNMPNQTGQGEMFALQAEIVAEGGPAILERLLQNIEPGSGYDVSALAKAIPVLAKVYGAESVLPLLDKLEKMPEPENREDGERRADFSPAYAFAQAAAKIVPLLGEKSPQKALELARRVRDENYGNEQKWRALAGGARFQDAATAAKLWREIVAGAGAESAPRYAARAFELDPKLGRELLEVARQKTEAQAKNEWQSREIWANYAFYSARADAAQARFILEREWGAATQKKTDGDQLAALAFAMSAIDGTRAWQMAREIPPDDRFSSFEARRKIGIYLTASEARRRDFPVGNRNYEEVREIEAE